MCMGSPTIEAPPPPPPVAPPPPPPPPPVTMAATGVKTAKPTSTAPNAPKRRSNPLRSDSYDSGAPDSVSTGLNIPV